MKVAKPRYDLIYFLSPVIVIGLIAIAWFMRSVVMQFCYLNWLVLAVLALTLVLPLGRQVLDFETPANPMPLHSWLLRIIGLQAALLGTYLGMCNIVSRGIADSSFLTTNLFTNTLEQLFSHFGLLPWGFYTLCGILMAYFAYNKNQDAYLSTTLSPLLKSHPQETLGLIVNTHAKQATIIALASTCALYCVLFATLLSPSGQHIQVAFSASNLFAVLVLFMVFLLPPVKRYFYILLAQPWPVVLSLLLVLMASALLLLGFTIMLQGLNETAVEIPTFISTLLNQNWNNSWHIFTAAWWIAWTPMMAAAMARLSRGRSLRQMIIGTLAFPSLVAIVLTTVQHKSIGIMAYPPKIDLFIAFVSFIALLATFANYQRLPSTILSYLPAQNRFKYRDFRTFLHRMILLMVVSLYIYLPGGISISYLLLFVMASPVAVYAILQAITLVKMMRDTDGKLSG